MTVLQTKLGMTRQERRKTTELQTKLGMTERDSVADKARNDKTRKEEHDSVADKARNDKKTKKEELTFITPLSLPSLATLSLTRADVQFAAVVTQLGAAV